jgi:hypothetical protein
MRKGLIAAAIGAATVLSVSVGGAAFASAQPHRGPIAPGRSVTATLVNSTPCTLQLTGGRVAEGSLTQSVPLVIGPYSSGTWKITGANAFGNESADLAVVFAVTGCAQAGEQEGYAMQNSNAYGLYYTDDACAVSPAAGLRNTFTAVVAYHAALTINLTTSANNAKIANTAVTGQINRPQLGMCGGLPLS